MALSTFDLVIGGLAMVAIAARIVWILPMRLIARDVSRVRLDHPPLEITEGMPGNTEAYRTTREKIRSLGFTPLVIERNAWPLGIRGGGISEVFSSVDGDFSAIVLFTEKFRLGPIAAAEVSNPAFFVFWTLFEDGFIVRTNNAAVPRSETDRLLYGGHDSVEPEAVYAEHRRRVDEITARGKRASRDRSVATSVKSGQAFLASPTFAAMLAQRAHEEAKGAIWFTAQVVIVAALAIALG